MRWLCGYAPVSKEAKANTVVHAGFDKRSATGLYVWDVGDDRVFSCETTASLFGLCQVAANEGLPVASFFDLIHPDDRARMQQVTLTGAEGVFRYQYRIVRGRDDEIAVRTVGYRFADESGTCTRHVGSIAAIDASSLGATIDIVDHCLAAYETAEASGRRLVQHLLSMVLMELGFDLAKGR